jgi:hypothetical protein
MERCNVCHAVDVSSALHSVRFGPSREWSSPSATIWMIVGLSAAAADAALRARIAPRHTCAHIANHDRDVAATRLQLDLTCDL